MQWIPDYLKELEEAIESIPAHVLAHFDYGFRKFNVTVEELKKFEPQLRALFQKMIEYNLAFELNCKSIYLYNHEDIYIYALSLVKELGGTKYSVGSDAHTLEHFRLNFDQIKQILTAFGIGEAKNKARILFPNLIRLFLKNDHSKYLYSLTIKPFSNSKISQDS